MNSNIPLAVDTGRGLSINYLGKNLYSKYNPSKNSDKIAQNTVLKENTLFFIPSPLLLYGLDILLDKLPDSSSIISIEIDQLLMKFSINESTHINNAKCRIVRLDSRTQLKLLIEDIGVWKFRRCEMITLNYGYNLYKDQYDYLFSFANILISTFWRNRLTINKLGNLWIKNILTNLLSSSEMIPDSKNKPVVICGAGSSLEESLSFIKSNRNKLYLMAVDTALNPLLEYGIIPDLVFALESQFYNLGDFYSSKGLKIDLLTDITGYPPVCRNLNGKTYFFTSDFFENKLLDRLSSDKKIAIKIPPLGSVGVAAVYSALELFKGNIFLTGLDFSFVPGKSHSKGSPFSNSMLRTSTRVHPAGSYHIAMNRQLLDRPGKDNNSRILTDTVLESYARLLIDIISQENRVYDLTTTGYPLGATTVDMENIDFLLEKNNLPLENIEIRNEQFNAISFYKNEIKQLNLLIFQWNDFIQSGLEEIPDCLMSALTNVDYIYINFPDRLPHPIKEISFISRAVMSARSYIQIIENLLN